ncbi:MAG: protein-glutamine gamma-glutamyltransferase, partial [Solirubrobacteraceae bacterium]|nr:protein-glutamine gamma-glutamyltransferase [Solirubrobacteraceae bacterium]
RAFAAVAAALAAGGARRGLPAPQRVLLGLAAIPLALLAAGLSLHDLRPAGWDELAGSLSSGLSASGTAHIPYSGSDEDIRRVLLVGGTLLTLLAGLLAFGPRRLPALVTLVALYAVPAVALDEHGEFARGGVLALLVIAYMRIGAINDNELGPGGCLALAGVVLAAALAPALDRDQPWFDYEAFASRSAAKHAETFRWNHDYGGITWKRTGRELLRVEASRRVYLKAENLDVFGGRWHEDVYGAVPDSPLGDLEHVAPANLRRWTVDVDVSVRDLRSRTLPVAGTTSTVAMDARVPETQTTGNWTAGREVHRGDAYRTQAYVPRPAAAELAAAGTSYGEWLVPYTSFTTPAIDPYLDHYQAQLFVPAFFGGHVERVAHDDGERVIAGTALARTYALSRQLLRGASTPYAYVQAVERYLSTGFTYDEHPPPSARTLPGFLFHAKRGYCQQFAGAMALLLRMGGVPARVAAGFAPGTFDKAARRYVVRDLDAHSWVEAWFPRIGWVTFDPTPAAAPPRSQAVGADLASAVGAGDTIADRGGGFGNGPVGVPVGKPPQKGHMGPLLVGFVGLGALAALVSALIRTRGPRRHDPLDALGELRLAFARAGDPVSPSTTLAALAARHPEAAAYLGALEAARYGTGAPPSRADRAGLRRALTHGLPPRARVRTWLVLRPLRRVR